MGIQRYSAMGKIRTGDGESWPMVSLVKDDEGGLTLYSDHIEREKVLREALNGIVKSLTKGNRGDDRMLSIDNMELSTLLKRARAALRTVEDSNGD